MFTLEQIKDFSGRLGLTPKDAIKRLEIYSRAKGERKEAAAYAKMYEEV